MRYRLTSDDIVFEAFDGETVVLNLATGQYFGLNASASTLWALLAEGADSADLHSAGVPSKWLESMLARLLDEGLMTEAPDRAADSAPLDLGAIGSDAPVIEAHSELSDLFAADPIHEVDAATGWPHLPPGSATG